MNRTGWNYVNDSGWHYVHINKAGRKELFSGLFSEIEEAVKWFDEWGSYWENERGIKLTLHTYKPGLTADGYYFDR